MKQPRIGDAFAGSRFCFSARSQIYCDRLCVLTPLSVLSLGCDETWAMQQVEVGEILLCDYPPDIREFRLFVLIRQKLTSASTPKLAPKRAERRLSRFHCSGLIFDSFFLLFFGPFSGETRKRAQGVISGPGFDQVCGVAGWENTPYHQATGTINLNYGH